MGKLTRREFGAVAGGGLLVQQLLMSGATSHAAEVATGPMIGHVSETTAHIWFRPASLGGYTVTATAEDGEAVVATADATPENDGCLTWELKGLRPDTRYRYSIELEDGGSVLADAELHFETAPDSSKPGRICLAFGSCARTKPLKLWQQMQEQGAQGLVLLGDTPYIDSTDLKVLREKHRAFLQVPELATLVRTTPTWATWDDHDFGKNDPTAPCRAKSIPVKRSPSTARMRSMVTATKVSIRDFGMARSKCLYWIRVGSRARNRLRSTRISPRCSARANGHWLQASLKASTAPFKIIACGMIWDDKENTESDDWGTYTHERSALFDFLGENDISGVLLIGGDIHCSRLLQYKTDEQVGYAIRQCIVSPIHDSTIPSLNVAHPDLIHGAAIPHVWLRVEIDTTKTPATLDAQWLQMDGQEMWDLTLDETELRKS